MLNKKILWIDNTPHHISEAVEILRDEGFVVETVPTASMGAAIIAKDADKYLAVIIDLLLPGETITVPTAHGPELLEPLHGQHGGITLGRWLKRSWPDLNIIGVSLRTDPKDQEVRWFRDTAEGYLDKLSLYQSPRTILRRINNFLPKVKADPPPNLKTYVIDSTVDTDRPELLRYLTSALRIHSPIILHDQADKGISEIKEAIVEESNDRILVFVLLPETESTRQNILFEAGCLYSTCLNQKGKMILLHHGDAGVTTKLPNMVTIDISKGIMTADNAIRTVVNEYLPLLRRH
ncbi:MAG: response regulator [Desulfobulbaceae bacterium]|nr:response regulator [Desulfobulbaceae bacterium]